MKIGDIPIKVNILTLIRAYKWIQRIIKRKKLKIKVIKKGCPLCKSDVEISGPFQICLNFGKGCNYIKIKGIKYDVHKETIREQ